jgi:hypothetical protein
MQHAAMSQHFLLTAAARTVSLKQVLRMEEAEAWDLVSFPGAGCVEVT